ncbi:hypothetical protein KL928_000792 [Ogataea angusta]|uniref:Uncharacterized protein n=1 Tax=Pichia angusta TaxID=870730 RepID=A0AAN6DM17_PICAN|nr:uncharacterized protein KL928_000792 [Ogataea angusta]KAG7822317.1 hypothetical protein KL928_000792 [Ogataea angusta]
MKLSSSYEWTLNYQAGRVETKWSERRRGPPPLRGLPWSRLHICPLVADPEAGGTDAWIWLINGIGYAMVREFILETELRNQQGLVWGVLDIPPNLPSGSPLCGTAVSQDSTVKEILRVIYSHIQRVQVWRFHAHSLD